ncbi:MAG: phosphate transport system permease protein [Chloroflexota bacterium]|nr:phosphate transport system permease protein [Chloroflexota bacterium]
MKRSEKLITNTVKIAGSSSILFILLIFVFLVREGLPALGEVSLKDLFSSRWYPIEDLYGLLPLISGSLVVTLTSILIALPLGVGTAIYIGEIAPKNVKEILKPTVEIMAGIPSVVLGFIGIQALSPFMREFFDLPTGLTALSGSILLAMIAIPSIVSIAEDALYAVPNSYRDASYALGATQWQTIWGVVLPAARNGLLTAVMLGIGRSLGETMAVMMVTGNAATTFSGFKSIVMPVRTMTATIASEMGEVASGSTHYHVLFFIGIILFVFSLIINISSSSVQGKSKQEKGQVIS